MKVSPWVALAAGTLLLVVGAAVLTNEFGEDRIPAHVAAPVAQPSSPVSASASPTATAAVPDTTTPPTPTPAPAKPQLNIPSVGLKAPLLRLGVSDGRVSPPSFADAFWLETAGFGDVHQHAAPALVAFHASTDPNAGALGDLIWDRAAQRSKLEPGDLVIADGVQFKVVRWFTQPKEGADRRDPAWTSGGDLLIVTCAEAADAGTTGVHANDNLVVVAERVS